MLAVACLEKKGSGAPSQKAIVPSAKGPPDGPTQWTWLVNPREWCFGAPHVILLIAARSRALTRHYTGGSSSKHGVTTVGEGKPRKWRPSRRMDSYLGREDLGALVEVEGEVAGEVEGPREPFP